MKHVFAPLALSLAVAVIAGCENLPSPDMPADPPNPGMPEGPADPSSPEDALPNSGANLEVPPLDSGFSQPAQADSPGAETRDDGAFSEEPRGFDPGIASPDLPPDAERPIGGEPVDTRH